jgi:hypothetical protein
MKRKTVALVTMVSFVLVLAVAYAQEGIESLEHDVFADRQRPAAIFSHELHADTQGIDCLECHHAYENGENVWDDSQETDCTTCHGLEAAGKTISAMKAFHTKCKGCHEEKGEGPVTCGECHPKKK